jgi:hypothetical protein
MSNNWTYPCDRCGKPADFDKCGGNCIECGDDLCTECGQWVGSLCKRCADKLGIKDEAEFDAKYWDSPAEATTSVG